MSEKKPQPAWRKKEGDRGNQQRQRRGGRRPDNKHDKRDKPLPEMRAPEIRPIEVTVRGDDIGQALRVLKTRMSKEGVLSEVKRRRHAEKPSDKKRRKHREAMKRVRKSKGRRRRQNWWKRGKRSGVVASVPLPDQEPRAEDLSNEKDGNEE